MPFKNVYGLFDPGKLNPNLIVVGLVVIIITVVLVISGRHKIKVRGIMEIETNVPDPAKDNSDPEKDS